MTTLVRVEFEDDEIALSYSVFAKSQPLLIPPVLELEDFLATKDVHELTWKFCGWMLRYMSFDGVFLDFSQVAKVLATVIEPKTILLVTGLLLFSLIEDAERLLHLSRIGFPENTEFLFH
ncbi:hypothetical protein VNO77_19000 [Canavalia gladiata]|uniref:Uncharacterized protein n=1 Tax=Canavalia gladiata TaxID=3824 RepID=A0AAN9LRS0_CANGL